MRSIKRHKTGRRKTCGCGLVTDKVPRRVVLTNERNIMLARQVMPDPNKFIDERFGGDAKPHSKHELYSRAWVRPPHSKLAGIDWEAATRYAE